MNIKDLIKKELQEQMKAEKSVEESLMGKIKRGLGVDSGYEELPEFKALVKVFFAIRKMGGEAKRVLTSEDPRNLGQIILNLDRQSTDEIGSFLDSVRSDLLTVARKLKPKMINNKSFITALNLHVPKKPTNIEQIIGLGKAVGLLKSTVEDRLQVLAGEKSKEEAQEELARNLKKVLPTFNSAAIKKADERERERIRAKQAAAKEKNKYSMTDRDAIKEEKGPSIKRKQKPPAGYDEDDRKFDDDEDTDIPSPKFKKFGKLSKKDAEKGWGSGPKENLDSSVDSIILQELEKMIEEHFNLEEGFLDRLKAMGSGLGASTGANISKARSRLAKGIAGKDSDVVYKGADPRKLKMVSRLISILNTMNKKYNKLADDFDNDVEKLGIPLEIHAKIGGHIDVLKAQLQKALQSANTAKDQIKSGKQTKKNRKKVDVSDLEDQPKGAKIKNRPTMQQVSAEPVPRTKPKRISSPLQARAKEISKQLAARGVRLEVIEKVLQKLLENYK